MTVAISSIAPQVDRRLEYLLQQGAIDETLNGAKPIGQQKSLAIRAARMTVDYMRRSTTVIGAHDAALQEYTRAVSDEKSSANAFRAGFLLAMQALLDVALDSPAVADI